MSITVKNIISNLRPLGDTILVSDMNFNERFTSSGIVLLSDNGKTSGIRPRWGYVFAIGPEQKDVEIGQWICVAHGRWTRGVEIEMEGKTVTIRKVDPNDILIVSDEKPSDDTLSTAIQAEQKSR